MIRERPLTNKPAGAARASIDWRLIQQWFASQGREAPSPKDIQFEDLEGLLRLPRGMSLYRIAEDDRWLDLTLGIVLVSSIPGQLPEVERRRELEVVVLNYQLEEGKVQYVGVSRYVQGSAPEEKLILPEEEATS